MTATAHCPACLGSHLQVVEQWPTGPEHRALACRDCGLLFVHPQPSQKALDAYYSPAGRWQKTRAVAAATHAQVSTKGAAPALMAILDRYFAASRPVAGARVLDFGCGTGTWLNSFQDCGWDTFGIEPSTDAAFVRHRRLDAIPAGPEFDLAIVYHVLEHLPHPLDTLRQISQAIRPDGHCLVSVPRLDTLGAHGKVKYCLRPHKHIVAFTEACLRGLLARAGLAVVATMHELDDAFTEGTPLRLRVLARKAAAPTTEPDPASALRPILDALSHLRTSPDSGADYGRAGTS